MGLRDYGMVQEKVMIDNFLVGFAIGTIFYMLWRWIRK